VLLVGLVNWNESEQTLRAIERLRSEPLELDIVVVDNGSTGDDVARLRARLGDERVLENGENRGYAGGMNAVLQYMLARPDVKLLLLLTPDAQLQRGALEDMVEQIRAEPGAGAAGPLVAYREGDVTQIGAGGAIEPARVRAAQLRRAPRSTPYAVDWIDGCCMLLRREAIAAVGGFDERYFIYFEETDFCERLRRAGWSIWVVPSALVRHPKGRVVPPAYYFYYMARNRYLFWRKNFQIGAPRVALGLGRELAGIAVGALKPQPAGERRARVHWFTRHLAGSLRGTSDYVRGRLGPMPERPGT
jgi:GT2 family glycosyltransferase